MPPPKLPRATIPQLMLSISTGLLFCVVTMTQAAFIRTPTSVNATLGSTATFTCSASRGIVVWMVNGSLLTGLSTTDIITSSAGNTFVLHIPATEEYNNTNVTCAVAILGGQDLYSDPVILKVQGKPAAVSSLTSASLTSIIHLTWAPPPTLDITGVDPNISYCIDIDIRAVAVADNNFSTPLTTICNVYIPKFNLSMDYPNTSTSVVYEFRVTPRNGAGVGPASDPVTGFFSGPPSIITEDMVEVSAGTNPLDVNLVISYVGGIPPGEMPNRLQLQAFTIDDDQDNTHCTVTVPFKLNSNGMVFICLDESTCGTSLVHHRRYRTIITATNGFGTTKSTEELFFSTHEVQTVQANSCSKPGIVTISCTFAENSTAMGYLSVLHPKVNSSQEMFVVANRLDTSSADLNISVPGVPPGDYTVIIFDLGSSGLPVLSAATNPYTRSAGECDNVTVVEPAEHEGDNVVHVDGSLLEVPDPIMNTELQLCISFESSTSSDQIVVLAHHADDPTKLSAYSPPDNECFRAPSTGNYSFAVFTQSSGSILEAPATPPEILIRTISTFATNPSWPSQATPPIPHNAGVASSIGLAVVVLLLIMTTLAVTASIGVVKSCRKKTNTDSEEPYYSTVNTERPSAIEMKENDAYGRPKPARQEILAEENPAYGVTGQNCHKGRQS